MVHPHNDAFFSGEVWEAALEKYADATHLTVRLFNAEARPVLGPIHPTPLFQVFEERAYDPGIFIECARRCLEHTDTRPAVIVSQPHGLTVVGTSLLLAGKIVGAAVGGYVFVDFCQASDIQSLARQSGIEFSTLWSIARKQPPVPKRRLLLHGELLQVLGDALLHEHYRRRQYEQAAAIINSSDDAIISQDLDSLITSWNHGAASLFGYTAQETLGQPATMLVPSERLDEETAIVARIHRGERIEHYETVRRRKDGTVLDMSISESPITDEQGRIVGVSKVCRDITEHKRAEDALRLSEERLRAFTGQLERLVENRTKELLQAQERLRELANELNLTEQRERQRMATELHDHLQQLLALGKLKLGQGKRLAETHPACAEIMKQVDQLLTDSLAYTRTLVAELSPPVLRQHGLAVALRWLAEYMKRHDITVEVQAPESHGLKLLDDQVILLFQSVRELLINASKYAGTGKATVTLKEFDGELRIAVHDDGMGFNPAEAASSQSDISSKFGLFSIHERMKALGGSFDLQSAPGHGTTAILSLPLASPRRPEGTREEQISSRHHSMNSDRSILSASSESARIRVLIVDDHAMVRQGLRTMLECYTDVEVVGEAADGDEAVAEVAHFQPAVVVMDINMPRKDGIEATTAIKARYPDVAIIGLSVNAGGASRDAMKSAGAAMLLTKEAAVEELYQAIQQVLHAPPR